jgi:hypothetical protein
VSANPIAIADEYVAAAANAVAAVVAALQM